MPYDIPSHALALHFGRKEAGPTAPLAHQQALARWRRRRWWQRAVWNGVLLAAVLALAAGAVYAMGAWLGD